MASAEDFRRRIRDNTLKNEQMSEIYDEWADTYDQSTLYHPTYGRSSVGCKALLEIVSKKIKGEKEIKILDCGAGTGFYGDLLSKDGYKHIDAVDGSAKMLDRAKELGVYKRTICSFVGSNPLDVETDTYDLILCVGSLYENHITDECFPELLRITKPGGYIMFLILEMFASKKFEETMQDLHDKGRWIWVETDTIDDYSRVPKDDGEIEKRTGLLYVFQKPLTST